VDPPDEHRTPELPIRSPYVTREEMERFVTSAFDAAMQRYFAPIAASVERIEMESVAARVERRARKQWEEEQRAEELSDAIREKTRSESDLIKAQTAALERPATPLQFVPVTVSAPGSDPAIKKPASRAMRWAVIVVPVLIALISTIGAIVSNRSSPHGAPAPAQGHAP